MGVYVEIKEFVVILLSIRNFLILEGAPSGGSGFYNSTPFLGLRKDPMLTFIRALKRGVCSTPPIVEMK